MYRFLRVLLPSLSKVFMALCFAAIIPFTAASELQAQSISFCDNRAFQTGPFAVAGTQSGLSTGYYRMSLSQSGQFYIHNLLADWNGIFAGGYQLISGTNTLDISGLISSTAPAGGHTTVTIRVYNIFSQLVLQKSIRIYLKGSYADWEKEWSATGTAGIDAYTTLYPGDFDGDGAEEILAVGSGSGNHVWMTMFHYENGNWEWGWSNYGDSTKGNGIYPYRNHLLVGDYDGDGKDEVFGGGGWLTMFDFENGDWQWRWSNNGNPSAGNGIYPYRNHLIAGDFDGDGKDEVLGGGGWLTMFHFDYENWQWGWSNYGSLTAGDGIGAYRDVLTVGNFDGDDKDEVLGLASWATIFHFDNGDWQWGWSTNGGNSFSGWTYPLASTDHLVIGDVNSINSNDEILFLQSGSIAGWSTMMNFTWDQPNWGWSNYANPPLIDDWILAVNNPSYFFVKAVANEPEFLFARKWTCSRYYTAMFRFCQQPGGC